MFCSISFAQFSERSPTTFRMAVSITVFVSFAERFARLYSVHIKDVCAPVYLFEPSSGAERG